VELQQLINHWGGWAAGASNHRAESSWLLHTYKVCTALHVESLNSVEIRYPRSQQDLFTLTTPRLLKSSHLFVNNSPH
jgi:hypothetical protein